MNEFNAEGNGGFCQPMGIKQLSPQQIRLMALAASGFDVDKKIKEDREREQLKNII